MDSNGVYDTFGQMESSEFANELDKRWNAAQQIINSVKEQVAHDALTPLDGVKIASCVTGTVFGYEEFHPRGAIETPGLVSALNTRLRELSPEFASAR